MHEIPAFSLTKYDLFDILIINNEGQNATGYRIFRIPRVCFVEKRSLSLLLEINVLYERVNKEG